MKLRLERYAHATRGANWRRPGLEGRMPCPVLFVQVVVDDRGPYASVILKDSTTCGCGREVFFVRSRGGKTSCLECDARSGVENKKR